MSWTKFLNWLAWRLWDVSHWVERVMIGRRLLRAYRNALDKHDLESINHFLRVSEGEAERLQGTMADQTVGRMQAQMQRYKRELEAPK